MSTFTAKIEALVEIERVSALYDAVAVELVQGSLTGLEAVTKVNEVREATGPALVALEEALGASAYNLRTAVLGLASRVMTLSHSVLKQARNPVELTVTRKQSVRRIVFDRFGSLDRLDEILELNPRLPSFNLIPAGTVVALPQS